MPEVKIELDIDLRELDQLIMGQRRRVMSLRMDGELFQEAQKLTDKLEQARKDYTFERDRQLNALRDNRRNVGNYGK